MTVTSDFDAGVAAIGVGTVFAVVGATVGAVVEETDVVITLGWVGYGAAVA